MITVSLIILFILSVTFLFARATVVLALRNIRKNRRRTVILLMVIVTCLSAMMSFFGFADDSLYNLQEATIATGLGHIQIYQEGYRSAPIPDRINFNIPNYGELLPLIENDPILKSYVKVVTGDLDFSGLVAAHGKSSIYVGRGVDTKNYRAISAADHLVEGKYLEDTEFFVKPEQKDLTNEFPEMFEGYGIPGEETKEQDPTKPKKNIWKDEALKKRALESPAAIDDALLGRGMSKSLDAKLGDALTLVVSTKSGALNALDVNVRGIILGVETAYDETIIKIPLKYAWKLMGREDVSKICILLNHTEDMEPAFKRVQELIKEKGLKLEACLWNTEARLYKQVVGLLTQFFVTIAFIFAIIVTFSIFNAMTMSVMERTREIGTLRALGHTKGEILRLFMTEGFVLGIIGGICSIIVAILIALFVNNVVQGIQMPAPPGSAQGYRAYFRVLQNPVIWAVAFNLAVIAAFLASILPCRKAANMEIVESIRYI